MKKPSAGGLLHRKRNRERLSPSEELRVRMWESRSKHSKLGGLVLTALSGIMLIASYLTGSTTFEITSLVSFILGVVLLTSELEPRVRLVPSVEVLAGPLLTLASDLKARGLDGKAQFEPSPGAVSMRVPALLEGGGKADMLPVGNGLMASFERELGPLEGKGEEYVKTWVPRLLVDGLELVEGAEFKQKRSWTELLVRRPYVTPLCVRKEFNGSVCSRFGCPMMNSVGEALAASSGKEVLFGGCTYDSHATAASALFKVNAGNSE